MPRPLRIEYNGAWYHVMNRGTNHQLIFHNDEHRKIFLSLLGELAQQFYIETHAYCLMDNHYHLMLRTPIANLGKAMRHLDGLYTQKFNRSENRDGPLFRGRYKAILVDAESYLLELNRYIHLNPLSINSSTSPYNYPWSSYQAYIGLQKKEPWLHTDLILNLFNKNRKKYQEFVDEGIPDEITKFYSKSHLSSILGKEDFITNQISQLNNNKKNSSSHDINKTIFLVDPEKILCEVANYFMIDSLALKKSIPGKKNIPKILSMLLMRKLSQLSYQKIADYFDTSHMNVAATLKRVKKMIQHDKKLKFYADNLFNLLANMSQVDS